MKTHDGKPGRRALALAMATLSAMTSEALDAPPRASSHRPLLVLFNLLVFGGVGGAMAWRRLAVE